MSSPAVEPLELARLQRWLQHAIVAPHERAARKVRARAARAVILPSPSLAPTARVAIYADAYFIRLRDCLAVDYPVVLALLGETSFTRLVRSYLERHPSRHYSLNRLGEKLPHFLAGRAALPRRALAHDIALLEAAMGWVFDAAPSPVIARRDLERVPADAWSRVRLTPITAFRLLALSHRANLIVSAVKQGRRLPDCGRRKTWVLVYRRQFRVIRMDLTEPMFVVLQELSAGRTIGRALSVLGRRFPRRIEPLAAQVFTWFRGWVQDGIFQSVAW
ncbi:MAG: DNA-binding domain-containing protein [Planctomycetota bacterium]